jgi:hypothetical protein
VQAAERLVHYDFLPISPTRWVQGGLVGASPTLSVYHTKVLLYKGIIVKGIIHTKVLLGIAFSGTKVQPILSDDRASTGTCSEFRTFFSLKKWCCTAATQECLQLLGCNSLTKKYRYCAFE